MGTKIDKPIKMFLQDFGLTDKEITCYLTLLKSGPNTIMNLARETGIKRSTTHNTVEELMKKGLISQTNYGERRMIVAEDPKKLEFLLEQKKWDMRKIEDNIGDIIKTIYDLVPKAKENTDVGVKYYDGPAGVKMIYTEALKSSELRSYVYLDKVLEVLPDNDEIFFQAQEKNKDLELREIIQDTPASRELAKKFSKHPKYHYKFAPSALYIDALDILIYQDKVAVISVGADRKLTGMIITNKDYHSNMRAIFDFVWQGIPKANIIN